MVLLPALSEAGGTQRPWLDWAAKLLGLSPGGASYVIRKFADAGYVQLSGGAKVGSRLSLGNAGISWLRVHDLPVPAVPEAATPPRSDPIWPPANSSADHLLTYLLYHNSKGELDNIAAQGLEEPIEELLRLGWIVRPDTGAAVVLRPGTKQWAAANPRRRR